MRSRKPQVKVQDVAPRAFSPTKGKSRQSTELRKGLLILKRNGVYYDPKGAATLMKDLLQAEYIERELISDEGLFDED